LVNFSTHYKVFAPLSIT